MYIHRERFIENGRLFGRIEKKKLLRKQTNVSNQPKLTS